MKKLLLIILMCALTLLFCGCAVNCAVNEGTFPQLRICRSNWHADHIYIPLRDNHNFNIQHLYDEVETENGYDIIIHITNK